MKSRSIKRRVMEGFSVELRERKAGGREFAAPVNPRLESFRFAYRQAIQEQLNVIEEALQKFNDSFKRSLEEQFPRGGDK